MTKVSQKIVERMLSADKAELALIMEGLQHRRYEDICWRIFELEKSIALSERDLAAVN